MVASIEDYSASVCIPQMVKAPQLQGGAPVQKNGRLVKYSGGFCVVFPFEVRRKKYALRCWHTAVSEMQRRSRMISEAIASSGLPYFARFEYVPDAIMTACGPQPVIVMDWVDGVPLKRYISANLEKPRTLDTLAASFLQMSKDLHSASFSHGDLQHCNILVRPDGFLALVDYDSMYVPGLDGTVEEIKGLPGYQHPARAGQRLLSPRSDYFSELVIYTSIRALSRHPGLWKKLQMEDSDTMLLSEEDIVSGGRTQIFDLLESDRELRPLGRALRDALRQTSLDGLQPLESCIEGPEGTIIKNLVLKWADNGYVPAPSKAIDYGKMAGSISTGWK